MANISFTGNTTNDAELKFTPNGKAVLNVNVAENHKRKNQQGEYEETGTTFRRVALWGKLAEDLADKIGKGSLVTVTGREETRFYKTKDGEEGKSLEVTADAIGVIYGKNGTGQQGGFQQAPQGGFQGSQQGGFPQGNVSPQGGFQGQGWGNQAPMFNQNNDPAPF